MRAYPQARPVYGGESRSAATAARNSGPGRSAHCREQDQQSDSGFLHPYPARGEILIRHGSRLSSWRAETRTPTRRIREKQHFGHNKKLPKRRYSCNCAMADIVFGAAKYGSRSLDSAGDRPTHLDGLRSTGRCRSATGSEDERRPVEKANVAAAIRAVPWPERLEERALLQFSECTGVCNINPRSVRRTRQVRNRGLPAWAADFRGLRLAMGANGLEIRDPSCPPGKKRKAEHASHSR